MSIEFAGEPAGERAEAALPSPRAAEASGPFSAESIRMAAQALALLQAGHAQASIGVYRALAQRHPELGPFCTVQIRAVELVSQS